MDFYRQFMLAFGFLLVAWLIFGWVSVNRIDERNQLTYACKIYTVNGYYDYIVINEVRHDLDSDGKIPDKDKPYVNPWHWRQISTMAGCIVINSRR